MLKEMVKAGVHFGHPTSDWNPKMIPYIYKQKNGVHIIDIVQTWFYLKKTASFLEQACSQKKNILIVGTKKQASKLVEYYALNSNCFFVSQRWLGGLLTNWSTIQKSIQKLNWLENNVKFKHLPKKEKVKLEKQKERLTKYLGGLKGMTNRPDIVIILGQKKELNAVKECIKLGLRTITILDTNCDPSLADLYIPANDDSIASLKLILNYLTSAILKGQSVADQINK